MSCVVGLLHPGRESSSWKLPCSHSADPGSDAVRIQCLDGMFRLRYIQACSRGRTYWLVLVMSHSLSVCIPVSVCLSVWMECSDFSAKENSSVGVCRPVSVRLWHFAFSVLYKVQFRVTLAVCMKLLTGKTSCISIMFFFCSIFGFGWQPPSDRK